MQESNNKLIKEIEVLQRSFNETANKLIVDINRHDKIMAQSDKRQKQQYDELLSKYEEVASLHAEIAETQKEIILTLGVIGEGRGGYEFGNHVKRVAKYSYILAKHYGLNEHDANMLKEASPMHDIGKVAIPDKILHKPSSLTTEEFTTMQTHTTIGKNMLSHSQRPLLKCAAIIAYEHHERYDGSGYPRGLSGNDIHIYGRITALADVFDALCSKRCYKDAWPDNEIFEYIKQQNAKQFDPVLVSIFFNNLDEILLAREELKD